MSESPRGSDPAIVFISAEPVLTQTTAIPDSGSFSGYARIRSAEVGYTARRQPSSVTTRALSADNLPQLKDFPS